MAINQYIMHHPKGAAMTKVSLTAAGGSADRVTSAIVICDLNDL